MLPHCDFVEQTAVRDAKDRSLKPDLIIHLPGDKHVVVDAKVPLASYLDLMDTQDQDLRHKHTKEHAKHIRAHIKLLSQKEYGRAVGSHHELVLLFLPTEALLVTALEGDKELLEYSALNNVVIATPMTLLTLLKTLSMSWHHVQVSTNAAQVIACGRQLAEHFTHFLGKMRGVGTTLKQLVQSYNTALTNLETTLIPAAQDLHTLMGFPTSPQAPSLIKTPLTIPPVLGHTTADEPESQANAS